MNSGQLNNKGLRNSVSVGKQLPIWLKLLGKKYYYPVLIL